MYINVFVFEYIQLHFFIKTCLPGQVISQNQEEIYNCEEHTLGTLYHKGLIQNPDLLIYTIGDESSFSKVLYTCM